MAIKLIATDMDGTLLRDDRTYDAAKLRQLLDEMQARGIRFVAASGNQYSKLRDYFKPVGPDQITYISDNGALVSHHGQILAKETLTHDQIKRILAWNKEHNGLTANMIILSGIHGAYVSNHATDEMINVTKLFYPNVYQVDRFLDVKDDIFRVSLIWDENEDVKEHIQKLRAAFGDELHTTGSGFGSVDILAPGVNKKTGLVELAKLWQIKPEEMVAFGDNDNDLEMLRYVKYPFVMPNAAPFMHKRIASQALNDNNHNGVVDTIEAILADGLTEINND